jgi:hypothetical protein
MKNLGPLASALGCVALLIVACGGSSFEAAEGGAGATSGGDDSAGNGGNTSAGSATAGKSSAGASSDAGSSSSAGASRGGTSNGGAETGGASSAGATSGGVSSAGSATGGAPSGGSGGNPLACDNDTDCAACRYATAPKTAMDCYCPSCGQTPLSKSACTANQAAWQKQCSQAPMVCPAIACVEPPIPQCKSHMCVLTP